MYLLRYYITITGTVTEHLLVWDGGDAALPEWTAGLDVESEEESTARSSNTRKDRHVSTHSSSLKIFKYCL